MEVEPSFRRMLFLEAISSHSIHGWEVLTNCSTNTKKIRRGNISSLLTSCNVHIKQITLSTIHNLPLYNTTPQMGHCTTDTVVFNTVMNIFCQKYHTPRDHPYHHVEQSSPQLQQLLTHIINPAQDEFITWCHTRLPAALIQCIPLFGR